MVMSPGTYLRKRREAAGLSIEELAEHIATEPRIAERDRAAWLRLIEADIVPIGDNVVAALLEVFPFDAIVLVQLVDLRCCFGKPRPRICRVCACSDLDGCRPPCAWVAPDLCSACPVDEPGEAAQPGPDDVAADDEVPHPVNDQAATGAAA